MIVTFAFFYSALVLLLGLKTFGGLVSLLFSFGFLGGFVGWIATRPVTPIKDLKFPFYGSLALFALHRVEEKYAGFFMFLEQMTDVTTPDIRSSELFTLVLLAVGPWLLIPWLVKRRLQLGYYFAWTFFASMGLTELAHWLVFPFFFDDPVRYIPGMWSVVLLAPFGWWGMWRLSKFRAKSTDPRVRS